MFRSGRGADLILNTDGTKPIYIQIAEWLEMQILNGHFQVDEKVYSQYKLAEIFNINPATAAKGLNVLFDENIVYNKRGLGKFVTSNAKAIITEKRRNQTLKGLMREIVLEARLLQITDEELMKLFQTISKESEGEVK